MLGGARRVCSVGPRLGLRVCGEGCLDLSVVVDDVESAEELCRSPSSSLRVCSRRLSLFEDFACQRHYEVWPEGQAESTFCWPI